MLIVVEVGVTREVVIVVIYRVALALSVVLFRFNFFISASDILIYCSVLECTIPPSSVGGAKPDRV